MLEGKTVNLKSMEKEDLPLFAEWVNKPESLGEYNPLWQRSKAEWEKRYDNPSAEERWFSIEKKDGTKAVLWSIFASCIHFAASNWK